MTASEPEPRPPYSPDRRTALVLTGTGTDGAYHAGTIRALTEAGVRVDLIAGRGVGAVGAIFGAIDGADRTLECGSRPGCGARPLREGALPVARRPCTSNVARGLAIAALLLTIPPLVLGFAAAVYQIAILSEIGGAGTAQWLADTWGRLLASTFAPTALPTRLPQPGHRGAGASWWLAICSWRRPGRGAGSCPRGVPSGGAPGGRCSPRRWPAT